MKQYVGIDISKEYVDVDHGDSVQRYTNTAKGCRSMMEQVSQDSHCVMEATGTYSVLWSTLLTQSGYTVSVVNPLQVKRFSQMKLSRVKTDRTDAQLLSSYGAMVDEDLPVYRCSSQAQQTLEQLHTVVHQLKKQQTAIKNQLEALSQLPYQSPEATSALTAVLETLGKTIKEIETRQQECVAITYPRQYECLQSIPGIGKTGAIMFITLTHGFSRFSSSKQLAAYLGVCPRITQSGSSVLGRSQLSKSGLAYERSLLYMCALAARRYNPHCQALFTRLCAKGKPKMVALGAVMHKLLRIVFAVGTKKTLFSLAS